MEMTSRRCSLVAKVLLSLLISHVCVLSGSSTVQYYGNYFNSDGAMNEGISVENACFEGNVILMPYELCGYSISAEGKGHTANVNSYSELYHSLSALNNDVRNEVKVNLKSENARYSWDNKGTVSSDLADISCSSKGTILPGDSGNGSALSEASSLLQATSHGKVITAESAVRASPATTSVASVEWGVEVKLGTEESTLDQYSSIRTRPGYLTFPTSQQRELITTGMTLEGRSSEGGTPLFEKRYVPVPLDEEHPDGFGYPLTLGVMKVEDDSVYMETVLKMSMKWQEKDL